MEDRWGRFADGEHDSRRRRRAAAFADSDLRPAHQRRHGGQDSIDVATGLQPEDRAAIVEQVELDIAAAPDELLLAVGIGKGRRHVAADDLGIDLEKGAADILR